VASAGDDLPDGVEMANEDSVAERLSDSFNKYRAQVNESEHAGAAMNAAMDAAEEFAELVVAAGDECDAERQAAFNQAKAFLNQLCDAKSALGRKDVRSYWTDQIEAEEHKATVEDGVPEYFEELVKECLESVTKTILTDKKKDETEYELSFEDGKGTNVVVSHSTLMSHEAMWKAYTSASGQYPLKNSRSGYTDSDWQNEVGPVIEELEEVEMEVGPRTSAYRSVENLIERSAAYECMGDAVEQGGLWTGEVAYTVEADDGETESRTVEELRVMREDIAQIKSQHDVTDRGLQIELKARVLSSPRVSGISESTYVNGSYQTYWCFERAEMPDPDAIVDEVADPMDRMDNRDDDGGDMPVDGNDSSDGGDGPGDASASEDDVEDDSSEESSDDTVDSGEPDDAEDPGPGKIGTFGVGTGGEGE